MSKSVKRAEGFRSPRGIRDVLPEEVPLWSRLEETASRLARVRGYREIRPALLEETGLFTRSVGEVTDIVQKEMFTLQKGDTSLTLRPEGTAGIVRAYLQAGYAKRAPLQRLFHTGPMFRYERPQKGRERMFTQFDVEALGSLDPRIDAEIIQMAIAFFAELGVEGLEVRMNSMGDGADRDRFREAVREYVRPRLADYSADSQARFERNVLRILDSKAPQDVELNQGAPKLLDFLTPENAAHFDGVRRMLDALGARVVVDPSIVRGMDYYTRTVFEIHAPDLGARSAVCGGGRYDHLIQELGGPDLGAMGFAVGFSGTLLVLEALGLTQAAEVDSPAVYVAGVGEGLDLEIFTLAEELRALGVSAIYDVEARATLKSQLKVAGKGGHRWCVILGPEEVARGAVGLKDLETGEQTEVPRGEVGARLAGAAAE